MTFHDTALRGWQGWGRLDSTWHQRLLRKCCHNCMLYIVVLWLVAANCSCLKPQSIFKPLCILSQTTHYTVRSQKWLVMARSDVIRTACCKLMQAINQRHSDYTFWDLWIQNISGYEICLDDPTICLLKNQAMNLCLCHSLSSLLALFALESESITISWSNNFWPNHLIA